MKQSSTPMTVTERVRALEASYPKTVKLRLFRDGNRYRDDVLVNVNGRRFLIRRGAEVEIPYAHYLCLMEQAQQDEHVAALVAGLEAKSRFAEDGK